MPFTAAEWEVNLQMGVVLFALQMNSLLSFPPEARRLLSKDHFSPHTSWVCPSYLETILVKRYLTSLIRMLLSLEPLAKIPSPHATELTRALWPLYSFTRQLFVTSQSYIVPLLVPMAIWEPCWFQFRLEIESGTKSQNFSTLLLLAFQKQRQESKATERMFWGDHSRRLRQKSSCKLGASSTLKGILLILRYSGSEFLFWNLDQMRLFSSLKNLGSAFLPTFSSRLIGCFSVLLPPKLNILDAFLSSKTHRYIWSTVIFSSFISLPRRLSSFSSSIIGKHVPTSMAECLRRGMKRSVVCFSFSFSSRVVRLISLLSWPTSSISNSDMFSGSSKSKFLFLKLLYTVEGVLVFFQKQGGLPWKGLPKMASISIKIKCANGNFIKNINSNILNKFYSTHIKIYFSKMLGSLSVGNSFFWQAKQEILSTVLFVVLIQERPIQGAWKGCEQEYTTLISKGMIYKQLLSQFI